MLPWPGRKWEPVPCAEPGTHAIKIPAVHNGRQELATVTTDGTQVTIEAPGGLCLEIQVDVWMQAAPHMTALALSLGDPGSPPAT